MNDLSEQATMPPPTTIPYGKCHCGCGNDTSIACFNSRKRSHIKGFPLRYCRGHNRKKIRSKDVGPNPYGLCMCGCGATTPKSVKTSKRSGAVQGCHARFCIGHGFKLPPAAPVNPSGLCLCGCGGKVTRALETSRRRGLRAGEFRKYIQGHARKNPTGHVRDHYVITHLEYPTPCWIWARSIDEDGYGRHSVDGTGISAHRYYHLIFNGPIPEGFHVDHLCVNSACVNPDHLEAVSPGENDRRKWERIRAKARIREIRKAKLLTRLLG